MGGGFHRSMAESSLPKLSAGPVGQQIHSIYRERLGQFSSTGQYSSDNLQGYFDLRCILLSVADSAFIA